MIKISKNKIGSRVSSISRMLLLLMLALVVTDVDAQIKIGGKLGIAPIFRIRITKTGDFIDAQVISTYQSNPNTGPHIDKNKQALQIIKSLSAADFYDNPPTISDDGRITK